MAYRRSARRSDTERARDYERLHRGIARLEGGAWATSRPPALVTPSVSVPAWAARRGRWRPARLESLRGGSGGVGGPKRAGDSAVSPREPLPDVPEGSLDRGRSDESRGWTSSVGAGAAREANTVYRRLAGHGARGAGAAATGRRTRRSLAPSVRAALPARRSPTRSATTHSFFKSPSAPKRRRLGSSSRRS